MFTVFIARIWRKLLILTIFKTPGSETSQNLRRRLLPTFCLEQLAAFGSFCCYSAAARRTPLRPTRRRRHAAVDSSLFCFTRSKSAAHLSCVSSRPWTAQASADVCEPPCSSGECVKLVFERFTSRSSLQARIQHGACRRFLQKCRVCRSVC